MSAAASHGKASGACWERTRQVVPRQPGLASSLLRRRAYGGERLRFSGHGGLMAMGQGQGQSCRRQERSIGARLDRGCRSPRRATHCRRTPQSRPRRFGVDRVCCRNIAATPDRECRRLHGGRPRRGCSPSARIASTAMERLAWRRPQPGWEFPISMFQPTMSSMVAKASRIVKTTCRVRSMSMDTQSWMASGPCVTPCRLRWFFARPGSTVRGATIS